MGVRIGMLFRSKQCQRNLNLESHDKLDDASLNAMRCIQLGARPPQVLISPLGPRACQVYFTGAGPLLHTQGFACFGNPQQLVGNLNELKFQARERIAAGVVTNASRQGFNTGLGFEHRKQSPKLSLGERIFSHFAFQA